MGYPAELALFPQSITRTDPSILAASGLPDQRYGYNNGIEFALPAGQNEFEVVLLDSGSSNRMQLLVDGFVTNSAGYDMDVNFRGDIKFTKIVLPASSSQRTIKLSFGWRPLVGLRLPVGQTLGAAPQRTASVVFQGDSITEGSGSTHPEFNYAIQASYRLGINDPIGVAIGGSGYLKRSPEIRGYNFRQRIVDVTQAVAGGPPDALVVAGGITDCGVAPPTPFSAAQVGAEAQAYFQALRQSAPNMLIFVLGPFTDYNNFGYTHTLRECREAIFAAAKTVPNAYWIDVSDWVTASNRDTVFGNPVFDGVHPTNAGHAIYGQRLAEAMATIIRSL